MQKLPGLRVIRRCRECRCVKCLVPGILPSVQVKRLSRNYIRTRIGQVAAQICDKYSIIEIAVDVDRWGGPSLNNILQGPAPQNCVREGIHFEYWNVVCQPGG